MEIPSEKNKTICRMFIFLLHFSTPASAELLLVPFSNLIQLPEPVVDAGFSEVRRQKLPQLRQTGIAVLKPQLGDIPQSVGQFSEAYIFFNITDVFYLPHRRVYCFF